MKILIAGLGSIGRRHFRNLIGLGEKELFLLRSQHATLPAHELAGYPVEANVEEALEKHKPNAVIVANPTALHLEIAIPAAKAGCHILLEKPVADSLGRISELQTAAQQQHELAVKPHGVRRCHCRLYSDAYRRCRRALRQRRDGHF